MSGKAIRETLGFLAVVAGLVFVGLEIRQNNAIARATALNELASGAREYLLSVGTDAETASILRRFRAGEELTADESSQANAMLMALLRNFENVFMQTAIGVVDSRTLLGYAYTNSNTARTEAFREFWPTARPRLHPDFVAAFEAEYDLAPSLASRAVCPHSDSFITDGGRVCRARRYGRHSQHSV